MIGASLLVFVEADHLTEHLLRDLVDRSQLEGRDGYVHVAQTPDYWLNFGIVNSIERLNHHQVVFLLGILHNRRLDRSKMLLVAQVDMIEQGALPG